jgi:hypothetical protein
MKWIDIWGDREIRVHSDYTLNFVITCFLLEINSKKWMKKNKNCIFLESDHEGAFVAL